MFELNHSPWYNPLTRRWEARYPLVGSPNFSTAGDAFTRSAAQHLCDKLNGKPIDQHLWVEPSERKFAPTQDDMFSIET